MPFDNTSGQDNNQAYHDVLHDIFDHEAASLVNNIIIGGDFNTDLSRSNSAHTRCLNSVCQHESMQCVRMLQICGVDYTYQSLINGQQSCLDHFVISQNMISSVINYSVQHDGDNLSDHEVVTLKLSLSFDNIRDISAFVSKPLWHKATQQQLERYRCDLDMLLSKIRVPKIALQCDNNFCSEHCELLEEYHDNIIGACLDASSCIPMSHQNKSNCVPGWNESVKVYKDKALFWHKLWKEGGSQTSGVLFDLRRKTRYQ